jgi:hypothetical protein
MNMLWWPCYSPAEFGLNGLESTLPVTSLFGVGLSGRNGGNGFGVEPETPTMKVKFFVLDDFFILKFLR